MYRDQSARSPEREYGLILKLWMIYLWLAQHQDKFPHHDPCLSLEKSPAVDWRESDTRSCPIKQKRSQVNPPLSSAFVSACCSPQLEWLCASSLPKDTSAGCSPRDKDI
jgi:hypothetical protein